MEKKAYVCIVCPRSCKGEVVIHDGEMEFAGYRCKRGEKYAGNEYASPVRMLTTTVRIKGAGVKRLPVVGSKEIPKKQLMDCMEYLYAKTFQAPVREGDVLVENILDTGADIIAAMDLAAEE